MRGCRLCSPHFGRTHKIRMHLTTNQFKTSSATIIRRRPNFFLGTLYMNVGLRNLCTPAHLYLVISGLFIVIAFLQNYGNTYTYCLGSNTCDVSNTYLIFILKIMYVIFWTWILNLICKSGATPVAWILVLFPFVLMLIMIGIS